MKHRNLLLIPMIAVMASCSAFKLSYSIENYGNQEWITGGDDETGSIHGFCVSYLYDTATDKDGKPIAKAYFNSSVLGNGFSNVSLPKNLIGGDYFMFYHTGTLLTQETYPSKVTLNNGSVGKYYYDRAKVHEFTKTSTQTWTAIAEYELWDSLSGKNVITDEQGHFVPLSEYTGDTLYVTEAAGLSIPTACITSDCHELKYIIGAMYAFEPDTSLKM